MTDLDPRLTDDNAQRVLARALELQAQNARALTVAQIREIATELSIPESAVDQALAEYRGVASDTTQQPARRVVISLAWVGVAFVALTIFFFVMRLFPSP